MLTLDPHMITKKNLKKRSDSLKKDLDPKKTNQTGSVHFGGMALRATSDMVGGIVVGCLLGWTFDKYFHTRHYGLIVGFLIGATAGLLNVYRRLCKVGYGFQPKKEKDL